MNAIDLIPGGLALPGIQFHRNGARQPPLRAIHDGHHHLQIAQQFGSSRGRDFLLGWPLRFEKQLRLFEDALADRGRALAPGGIQKAGLTRITVMLTEDRRHSLAVLQALARHRHQILQGYLCRDLALAHLLLNRFWQNLYQCQPPRYPAHAAIESSGQLIQPVAEALLQLRQ